ncbi:MAG: Fur family transcriptional regulator [Phycisphaerae bacterium]
MAERNTRQMDAIRGVLEAAGRPLSPKEILDGARGQVPNISLATIYRRLKQMCADRVALPIHLPGQAPRYELQAAAAHHHHHFHCEACDRVFDVEGCPGGVADLAPTGFEVASHEIVLYGRCDDCQSN